jgi:2-dehydro-3-deoxyphosphooctonate aldolase (KDO 8-P synthase)
VLESRESALRHAGALREICAALDIPFIFKSSYDKANRTSHRSFRGPGLRRGLAWLVALRRKVGVPVLTDVHSPEEARSIGKALDVLQVPAFLCRQTDLVAACARFGAAVNIKKGQFVAPMDMRFVVDKAVAAGNRNVLITERGFSFGYGNLVVDMRSVAWMRSFGYPVVIDAGHSVQRPSAADGASGGDREMIPVIARAGVAAGADGLFLEVHEDPDRAPSDGPNMLRLDDVEDLLRTLKDIHKLVRARCAR